MTILLRENRCPKCNNPMHGLPHPCSKKGCEETFDGVKHKPGCEGTKVDHFCPRCDNEETYESVEDTMANALTEGPAEDYAGQADRAKAASHRAHTMSVAAHKTTGLHDRAAQYHKDAHASHSFAASLSTHGPTKDEHKAAADHHEEMGWGHDDAHEDEVSGAQSDAHATGRQLSAVAKKHLSEEVNAMSDISEQEQVAELVRKIADGNHADAMSDFDAMMDNKLDMKLTDRTKEMAAQIFGPSVIESLESLETPDEDDEVATELQTLADTAIAAIEEEGDEIDEEVFVESFNAALEKQGILEYKLWRPEENGAKKSGVVKKVVKKVPSKKNGGPKRAASVDKIVKSMSKIHGHNQESVEDEVGEDLQELKARTLRHYVGHAQKQIKSAEQEVGRAKAQGKGEVESHFKDRIAKRKKGIKTVLGKQKASASARADSAKAKIADVKKTEKNLEK